MTKTRKTNKNRSVEKEFNSNFLSNKAVQEALKQAALMTAVGPVGAAAVNLLKKKK